MLDENLTVFVVGQDNSSRASIRALVKPMGVLTAEFSSAEEFLAGCKLETSGCLVTDLQLSGMSGIRLQQTLNERGLNLPTVVLARCCDVPSTVQSMRLGAFTVLQKPCTELELWESIRIGLAIESNWRDVRQKKMEMQAMILSLTEQEFEVIVDGMSNKAVAIQLDVSLRTIEGRRKSVFRKTSTHSVAELVRFVLRLEQPMCNCAHFRLAQETRMEMLPLL
jgi:FixJ family two-component response regulator